MPNPMKISIIVPSYNQGKFIERALRSLEKQDDENLEILVMDGGSTDNSVEVIHKFEHIITYWQSEKDGGQSAAINEGIRRATGDWVVWFNTVLVTLKPYKWHFVFLWFLLGALPPNPWSFSGIGTSGESLKEAVFSRHRPGFRPFVHPAIP